MHLPWDDGYCWVDHRTCRAFSALVEEVSRFAKVARQHERRLVPAHLRHLRARAEMLWSALRQHRVIDVEGLCSELSEWR